MVERRERLVTSNLGFQKMKNNTFGLREYQLAVLIIDDDFVTTGYYSFEGGDVIWHCRVDDGLWSTDFIPIGVESDFDRALCPGGLLATV